MVPDAFSAALDGDCMLIQRSGSAANSFSMSQHEAQHNQAAKSRAELTLSCFASLLSSAQTTGLEEPLLSSGEQMLTKFLSTNWSFRHVASFPSLSLKNNISASQVTQEMSLQNVAALNLAIPLSVSRDDIMTVPASLLKNTSKSFMHLVDSRLRSSLAALVQQTHKLGSASAGGEAAVLLRLLTSSSAPPIAITTVVTSFNVLESQGSQTSMPSFNNQSPDAEPLMLPLIFDAVVDVKVLGKVITVPFQCPGTISGLFNHRSGLLDEVEVAFDTIELLKAMMEQARVIVKKVIARAAGIASSVAKNLASNNTPSADRVINDTTAATALKLSSLPTCGSLAGGSTTNLATLAAMQSFNSLSGGLNARFNVNSGPNSNTTFPKMLSTSSEANLFAALAGAGLAGGASSGIGNSSKSGLGYANLPQHLQNAFSTVQEESVDNQGRVIDETFQEESLPMTSPEESCENQEEGSALNSHTHHRDLFSWLQGSDMLLKEGQEHAEANAGSSNSRSKRKRRSSSNNEEEEVAMPQRFFTSDACDAMYAASDMFAVSAAYEQQEQQQQDGSTESEEEMPPPPEKKRKEATEEEHAQQPHGFGLAEGSAQSSESRFEG